MASTDKAKSVEDLDVVVDTDAHVMESQSDFMPYLDDPFRSLFNRGEGTLGEFGMLYPRANFMTNVHTGKVKMDFVRTQEDLLDGMDMLDTDKMVVTPTLNLYLGAVHHDELAAAFAQAYNDWLLDKILDGQQGIFGAAVIAPQLPSRAVEEIDKHATESDIVAVFFPTAGASPALGNERYYPIYEACESHGLPIMFHNGFNAFPFSFPIQFQGTSRGLSVHVPYHSMEHMTNLSSMLTHGVPVRFPDLKFVVQEAGLGWIPYFMYRYDDEYNAKREEAPLLEAQPSEYIQRQFYFTTQPLEGTHDIGYVSQTISSIGPESVMFSSDYPHNDFDNSSELLQTIRSRFESEELSKMYGGTAERVFGI